MIPDPAARCNDSDNSLLRNGTPSHLSPYPPTRASV